MKHRHHGDRDGSDHHHRRHGRHGGRGHRPFDYGELRLLILSMLVEQPRHGYDLIRAIEERMGGTYTPSPGVIYPTLAWLEDSGFARPEEAEGRKSYSATKEGKAFLAANQAAVDDLVSRTSTSRRGGRYEGVPAPIMRGMENLKVALRLRLRSELEASSAETIAAALDAAAKKIEGA